MDAAFDLVREAAYAGDFERFSAILENDPALTTLESRDSGDSPNLIQFIVVEGGLRKIEDPVRYLKLLIDYGADPSGQLVAAASVNARELVDVLLDVGVSLDDGAPWTAVEESLYWQHRSMADYLIERGASVATLSAASMLGDIARVSSFFVGETLREDVLPIHFPWGPIEGSTRQDALNQSFFLSLRHQQYHVAEFLLDRGAQMDVNAPGHHEECTALHQAVYLKDTETIDWLLDRGASVEVQDLRFTANAAQWADHFGDQHIIDHLHARLND